MQLSSFLQLISDLNQTYTIYYRPHKQEKYYPIVKITLSTENAILKTGKSNAKTIAELEKILHHVHHLDTKLLVDHNNYHNIYGIQIDIKNQNIYLV